MPRGCTDALAHDPRIAPVRRTGISRARSCDSASNPLVLPVTRQGAARREFTLTERLRQDLLEGFPIELEDVRRGRGADGRGSRDVLEERGVTEVAAGPDAPLDAAVLDDVDLSRGDDEERMGLVALLHDALHRGVRVPRGAADHAGEVGVVQSLEGPERSHATHRHQLLPQIVGDLHLVGEDPAERALVDREDLRWLERADGRRPGGALEESDLAERPAAIEPANDPLRTVL